ncbi:hypothetical protein [Mycobacteroides abscessus]|uniref:hypothetical protein n=1 Tax=Mycobacteroides abscessus TaxID=36809 RepID=UPI0009271965|nr:hypothetical protein [Mycobacteroides abscessus]QSN49766.1 hypothetical protein I3U33_26925 [Mycobacteroides abscessus subsp. abscessus]SII83651.1 Uncharacterised protein [Mycobacteroides abscessus subsp. abscessus]SIK57464.1 Uncharacterised protein [Mycobacteroides abscessus subsp. abscessus]SIL84080.1 Uncharacterised protein [Mycobacteroides abscessus subsp. abscessus]SIM12737.1 Uncharacterised protein [Mycobacteroides abscessus subsp. abscessus]
MTGPNEVRIPPRNPGVSLGDLKFLVRVAEDPAKTLPFAQEVEARAYAREHGGVIEPLPVPDGVWDWDTGRPRVGQDRPVIAGKAGSEATDQEVCSG